MLAQTLGRVVRDACIIFGPQFWGLYVNMKGKHGPGWLGRGFGLEPGERESPVQTLLFIFRHTWKKEKISLCGTSANLPLVLRWFYVKLAVCELMWVGPKKRHYNAPLTNFFFTKLYLPSAQVYVRVGQWTIYFINTTPTFYSSLIFV